MKVNKKLIIILSVIALVLALAAVGVFGFLMPYLKAECSFPEQRTVSFYQRPDGRLQMCWPIAEHADRYVVEVLIPQDGVPVEQWRVESSANIDENAEHILASMNGQRRAIRIQVARAYKFLFSSQPRYRLSDDYILMEDTFVSPDAPVVNWVPDPDSDTVSASFTLGANCFARAYYLGESSVVPFESQLTGNTTFSFGEGHKFPVPKHGEMLEFAFDTYRQEDGFVFYSALSQTYTVTREDLLGLHINLSTKANSDNTYTLSWGEAKGEYYVLQHRDTEKDKWEDVKRYEPADDLSYTTEAYEPYTYRQFRVLTYHTAEDGKLEQMSNSDILPVDVKAVVNYATIWPIKELVVYSDAAKTQETGKVAAGKAFCALSLEEGMFQVRTAPDTYGYIDSNYCMINLPDMLGDLLEYDIANSYASLFNFHGVPIEGVTGQIVIGYEKVMHDENTYLVPYLYPCALKLEKAGVAAQEKGYGLKIFDSFRPQEATRDLYKRMVDKCPTPIPLPTAMPAYNVKEEEEDVKPDAPVTEEIPEPLPQEYLDLFVKADGTPMTYQEFITDNNRYKLNYFLANGTSRHNRGAALDLTLTKKGENQEMQTIIHDLCWYSETKRNTSAAKTLASIMKSAGFGGLVSEWWHFQDNDALNKLDLPALKKGVTPECWVADGNGWRYRQANGKFYKNTTKTIEDVAYRFDSEGYATLA